MILQNFSPQDAQRLLLVFSPLFITVAIIIILVIRKRKKEKKRIRILLREEGEG